MLRDAEIERVEEEKRLAIQVKASQQKTDLLKMEEKIAKAKAMEEVYQLEEEYQEQLSGQSNVSKASKSTKSSKRSASSRVSTISKFVYQGPLGFRCAALDANGVSLSIFLRIWLENLFMSVEL